MSVRVLNNPLRPSELAEALGSRSQKSSYLDENSLQELLSVLHQNNFPDIKQEEYRFFPIDTYLRKATSKTIFAEDSTTGISDLQKKFHFPELHNLYLFNGKYLPNHDALPEGIEIYSFPEGAEKFGIQSSHSEHGLNKDIFHAIALLYPSEGLCIHIKKTPSLPLCIWHIFGRADGGFLPSHVLTKVDEHTHADIYEFYVSLSQVRHPVFVLDFHEKQVSSNASLNNYLVQDLSPEVYLLSQSIHFVKRNGTSRQWIYSVDGSMIRNNHSLLLSEPEASGELRGISIGKKKNIIDHHTLIRHARENGKSYELYKGIADDESHLIFNGKIFVAPHAQQTDSFQNSKFLLLGSRARVQAKPQLEIFANNVKCSHGSATGKPDEDALFYMQSRGIPKNIALQLWSKGFIAEIIKDIPNPAIQSYVESRI